MNKESISMAVLTILVSQPVFGIPLSQNRYLVNRVVDGDTLVLENSVGTLQKVRLACVDAPEKKQEFGIKSKQFLDQLLSGREVEISASSVPDRYNRLIGIVYPVGSDGQKDSTSVNEQLLSGGYAWFYATYAGGCKSDAKIFEQKANTAKKSKLGLWKNPEAVAPWLWRWICFATNTSKFQLCIKRLKL